MTPTRISTARTTEYLRAAGGERHSLQQFTRAVGVERQYWCYGYYWFAYKRIRVIAILDGNRPLGTYWGMLPTLDWGRNASRDALASPALALCHHDLRVGPVERGGILLRHLHFLLLPFFFFSLLADGHGF